MKQVLMIITLAFLCLAVFAQAPVISYPGNGTVYNNNNDIVNPIVHVNISEEEHTSYSVFDFAKSGVAGFSKMNN